MKSVRWTTTRYAQLSCFVCWNKNKKNNKLINCRQYANLGWWMLIRKFELISDWSRVRVLMCNVWKVVTERNYFTCNYRKVNYKMVGFIYRQLVTLHFLQHYWRQLDKNTVNKHHSIYVCRQHNSIIILIFYLIVQYGRPNT